MHAFIASVIVSKADDQRHTALQEIAEYKLTPMAGQTVQHEQNKDGGIQCPVLARLIV